MRADSVIQAGGRLSELEATLKNWVKFHGFTLMSAFIHALSLPEDIERANTHLLRLRIAPVAGEDPLSAKWQTSFRIHDISVLEQAEARLLGQEWNDGLDRLATMRIQDEEAGRGTVGVIAIQCAPLAVYFAPIGSLKDFDAVRVLPGYWRMMLTWGVAQDRRFTSLEDTLKDH